ncbi:MAG TPA: T9SS type A sorting domain-containing protein [Flavobacterium sp.]|jgi:hypothetical protein
MRNIYLLLFASVLAMGSKVNGQILNQSANWPNAGWTITGSYATGALMFESDPTTTTNFAFDDDDAGSGHEDNIAAESPIIDLTAAHAGGETNVEVTVQYGYRYLADDVLRFEYWDAATATWVPWGASIPGNNTSANNNYCTTITKTTFTTPALDISGFTPAQLAGFRYRIYYNDSLTGADYNYGFCFDAPVIKSLSCVAPSLLATSALTHNAATITWATIAGVTNFEYVLNTTAADPASGTVISANSYAATGLTPLTTYYFHVRTVCSASNSEWRTFSFTTLATPPANDEASGAIALTANADLTCTATTNATTVGGTASADAAPSCSATGINDDVWFTFTATSTAHRFVYSAVTTGTMATALYTGTPGSLTPVAGACQTGATQNFGGLTVGTTYYARVYTTVATAATQTTFTVCVSTPPAPPANDSCDAAVALTVNSDLNCTVTTAGTTQYATQSMAATPCGGTPDDDVYYSFVATGAMHQVSLTGITAVEGTGTDMYFQVLSGACGALTSVQCSDDNTATITGLTAGSTYFIRVYSWGSTMRATFNICVGSFPPPPANDDAAGAIALTVNADLACSVTTNGTTVSATASTEAAPSCSATGTNDDVWYTFTATAATQRFVYSNVTTGTIATALYTGTPGSLVPVANACFSTTTQDFSGLTAGTTYYARVYTTSSTATTSTTFTVCVGTLPSAPANDEAAGAIALTVNADYTNCTASTNGSTVSATASTETAPSCNATGVNDDVWYTFTATSTAVRLVYSAVTTGTMASALYTGTPGSLTQVADGCQSGTTLDFPGLTVGTTYYVRVYTTTATASTTTNFTVCLSALPAAPANDLCANATPLIPGATFAENAQTGSNFAASTTATGLTYTCQTTRSLDVWYSVVVPASGSVTIETNAVTGSPITDTVLSAFSGSCGALTQIGCSDDEGTGNFSLISLTGQTPGSTILVGVWRYSTGVGGEFQISAHDASLGSGSFDRANFTFYPNPVKDVLAISYSESITGATVFNMLGQALVSTKVNATQGQLDMSSLPAGTYIVKVDTENGSTTMKVIKE